MPLESLVSDATIWSIALESSFMPGNKFTMLLEAPFLMFIVLARNCGVAYDHHLLL